MKVLNTQWLTERILISTAVRRQHLAGRKYTSPPLLLFPVTERSAILAHRKCPGVTVRSSCSCPEIRNDQLIERWRSVLSVGNSSLCQWWMWHPTHTHITEWHTFCMHASHTQTDSCLKFGFYFQTRSQVSHSMNTQFTQSSACLCVSRVQPDGKAPVV